MSDSGKTYQKTPPVSVLPALGWLLSFFLAPIAIVVLYSFSTRGPYGGIVFKFQIDNYLRSGEWIYLKIFLNSLKLAISTTLSCFLIGFPMAYVMATAKTRYRNLLLISVMIPFWTNFVVRAYAIKVVLSETGPLNAFLMALGLIVEPLQLSNSALSVWIGMVTNYLPFMVLPLYVTLEKFDFGLLEAARDLGASPIKVLIKVLLPLSKSGILTGSIFVFTPALGEFVIPDLLGGAKTMLFGNLVTEQFLKARDWPFGSALSLILILSVMCCLVVYLKNKNELGAD